MLRNGNGLLSKSGENSQAVRFFTFANLKELIEQKSTTKAFIYEAIDLEKAGFKVIFKSNTELELEEELQNAESFALVLMKIKRNQ